MSQRECDAALAELVASRETLEIAADAAEFGLFEHDVRRDVASWSPRARPHFGLSPDAPVDAGMLGRAVHPEDRERVQGEIAAMLAAPPEDGRYRGEYRVIGLEWAATARKRCSSRRSFVRTSPSSISACRAWTAVSTVLTPALFPLHTRQ